jgi:hypothetical protein
MNNILCIDVGGTRIKAAILKDNIDLNILRNTEVEVIRSLGWLNASLPNVISRTHPSSILQRCIKLADYDSISISVPAQVINNGTEITGYYVEKRGVPPDLKKAFEDQGNCEVVIMNDAICWLSGALNYCRLYSIEVEYPCLFIALGTGVGIGFSKHSHHIEHLELSNYHHHFSCLGQASGTLVDKGWKVHVCLGEKYFYSLKSDHKAWTILDIQADFTERLIALLLDIEAKGIDHLLDFKTIFIGGGNAEYINYHNLRSKLQKKLFIFKADNLEINPDLIPLLGQVKLF